ncbi:hypothetical protein MRX96_003779 [Rhipicephalus microplus]
MGKNRGAFLAGATVCRLPSFLLLFHRRSHHVQSAGWSPKIASGPPWSRIYDAPTRSWNSLAHAGWRTRLLGVLCSAARANPEKKRPVVREVTAIVVSHRNFFFLRVLRSVSFLTGIRRLFLLFQSHVD